MLLILGIIFVFCSIIGVLCVNHLVTKKNTILRSTASNSRIRICEKSNLKQNPQNLNYMLYSKNGHPETSLQRDDNLFWEMMNQQNASNDRI